MYSEKSVEEGLSDAKTALQNPALRFHRSALLHFERTNGSDSSGIYPPNRRIVVRAWKRKRPVSRNGSKKGLHAQNVLALKSSKSSEDLLASFKKFLQMRKTRRSKSPRAKKSCKKTGNHDEYFGDTELNGYISESESVSM
eukprot:174324-Hanusia_phi.AAC.1